MWRCKAASVCGITGEYVWFSKKQMISVKVLLKLVYDIALGYSIPLCVLTFVTFGTFIYEGWSFNSGTDFFSGKL